jgi:prepilin-type N-terminal cleavage/methylation domain-containing protein
MMKIMVSPLYIRKHRTHKGFTLIELLVVISIVAMLSSVVLVSLKKARDKALDSKVKQQLRNLRTAAEVYKNNRSDNSYGPVVWATNAQIRGSTIANGCADGMFADPTIAPYFLESNYPSFVLDPASGNTTRTLCMTIGTNNTDSVANRYFVVVKLSDGSWYCVDSVGSQITRSVSQGNPVGTRVTWSDGAVNDTAQPGGSWYTLMDDCNYMLNCT